MADLVALRIGEHDTPRATASEPDRRARRLSEGEFTSAATVAALVGVLALLGFVNSFKAVMEAAAPSFGRLAFTVPLAIDLGIAIFAALDIVLARLDMRLRWLRLIPWTLTAATVYLNVASEHTMFGWIAHAVLPGLWVIAVEVAAHVVRVRAGIEAGTRMDTVRASRWILAPWPTAKLWRRMVLWEIRSYPAALRRERDRLLALTELQDTYGRIAWRWKAPRRTRALYRLGELAAAATAPEVIGNGPGDGGHPTGPRADARSVKRPAGKSARKVDKTTDKRADKARALLAADPGMSGAELGRRLRVSERTGSRLRARLTQTTETTPTGSATGSMEGDHGEAPAS
jgi:hypothetical protein